MDELSGEERLRREVAGLPDDEILALCYAFAQKPERLRLYLDVLRRRGGQRAQFSACLICFDLARQGDEPMQKEFVFLAGTIRQLADDQGFVDAMLGGDAYLTFIWELLSAQLAEMDARFDTEHTVQTTHPSGSEIATLELLTEADFGDELAHIDFDVDEPALQHEFNQAVERFLGKIPDYPAYDPKAGFRAGHRSDTDRIEAFLLSLESLRRHVPNARAFRALALLFYATHMRSKSLFGATNERKQAMLLEGLGEFLANGELLWDVVGVLDVHGESRAWRKIAEVILDFLVWMASEECGPESLGHYPAVERQVRRDGRRGAKRRTYRDGS